MPAHRGAMQTPTISDDTLAELKAFSEWNRPHWRTFIDRRGNAKTVCIQPTDYAVSTWDGTFIDDEWYETEAAAERAVDKFLAIWDGV